MIFALPVIAAAARGMVFLVDRCMARFYKAATVYRQALLGRTMIGICLVIGVGLYGRDLIAPINLGYRGYRQAGEWLAANSPSDARVLDLKGWAAFYGERAGFTFRRDRESRTRPCH